MLAEAALLAVLSVDRGSGAEACLDRDQLEHKVEQRLKRRVFVAEADASLRVRVVFTTHDDQVEARIELSSIDGASRGTRSLVTAGHCSTLDDSLALSVALLVDEPPDPVEPAPAPASASPSAAAPPPTPAPAAPSRVISIPADVGAPREPWHVRVGAAGKGTWGNLPGVRPAAVLSLSLVPRNFVPILLQGEAFWPTTAERDARSGAHFHLLRAGLALCPVLWSDSGRALGLCAGQELGWLTVGGYGFNHNATQQRLNYSLTFGGEGRLRLFPPVSVRGYLGGEVPLTHDRFTSGGRNAVEIFQPIPVTLVGEIGLEAALW